MAPAVLAGLEVACEAPPEVLRRSRGFGLFYTLGIGASAMAPFVFGVISDLFGVAAALVVVALLVTTTLPLTLLLRGPLASSAGR